MEDDAASHVPVLLHEAVEALSPRADGIYVDCTFGRGGHCRELLCRLGASARVIALDRDPSAVAAGVALAGNDPRLEVVHAPFASLCVVCAQRGVHGRVNGVLFDLGVSSAQLDVDDRGFGFKSETLDMRMDPTSGESAAEWLQGADAEDIENVLREFGEERFARRIARAIVREREQAPLDSAARLASIVARAVPTRERGKHPATRTFQALRIHVNDELGQLRAGLDAAVRVLAPAGRLAVISFHSLEDRIVKRFIRGAPERELPPDFPLEVPVPVRELLAIGRPLRPGAEEVASNPRARSALLRVAERSR